MVKSLSGLSTWQTQEGLTQRLSSDLLTSNISPILSCMSKPGLEETEPDTTSVVLTKMDIVLSMPRSGCCRCYLNEGCGHIASVVGRFQHGPSLWIGPGTGSPFPQVKQLLHRWNWTKRTPQSLCRSGWHRSKVWWKWRSLSTHHTLLHPVFWGFVDSRNMPQHSKSRKSHWKASRQRFMGEIQEVKETDWTGKNKAINAWGHLSFLLLS